MLIKLKNFKCYTDREFDLPDTGVVLLNGESGAGKTTLITAIMFCLYGNVRKITNFLYPNTKTSVEIFHPRLKITIYRQKKPDLLKVTQGDKTFEDDEAQALIDHIFGNDVLFENGSYVKQKRQCALLEGTNAERMDHISRFAFEQDSSLTPYQLKDSIQKHITSKEKALSVEQALFSRCQEEYDESMKKIENTETPPEADEISDKLNNQITKYEEQKKDIETLEQQITTMNENRATLNSLETLKEELYERSLLLKDTLVGDVSEEDIKIATKAEEIESICYNARIGFRDLNEQYVDLERTLAHVEKPSKSKNDAENTVVKTNLEYKTLQIKLKELSTEFIKCGEANAKLQTLKDHITATTTEIEEEEDVVSNSKTTESDIVRTEKELADAQAKLAKHSEYMLNEEKKNKLVSEIEEIGDYSNTNLVGLQYQIEICQTLQQKEVKKNIDNLWTAFQKCKNKYDEGRGELLICPNCDTKLLYRDEELHPCCKAPKPYNKRNTQTFEIQPPNTKSDWVKKFRALEKIIDEDPGNDGIRNSFNILKDWLDSVEELLSKRSEGVTLENLTDEVRNVNIYQELVTKYEALPVIEQPKDAVVDCKRSVNVLTKTLEEFRCEKAACEASAKRLVSLKARLAAYNREANQLSILRHPKTVENEINDTQKSINKVQTIIEENTKLIDFWNKYNDFVSKQKVLNDLKAKIQKHISVLKEHKKDGHTIEQLKESHEKAKIYLSKLLIQKEQSTSTHREYNSCIQQIEQIEQKISNIDFDDTKFQELKTSLLIKHSTIKQTLQEKDEIKELFALREKYDEVNTRQSALQAKQICINRCNSELESLYKIKNIAIKAESQVLLDTIANINKLMAAELEGLFDTDIKVLLETTKQLKSKDVKKFQLNCNIKYKGFNYDDISSLSGGESDRVSLAMVCALNRISGSHILILDETIGSMGSELKLDVLDALRTLGSNRLILVVNHEGVLGAFDKVIDV